MKIPIRSANKPTEGMPVAGVALLATGKGVGYFYIKVSDDLVKFLGKKMPQGVGPENEAYIKILQKRSKYEIRCQYRDKTKSVLLGVVEELPSWVKRVKYKEEESNGTGKRSH